MTGMFVGLHALLADRTNVPQIAITEDEGARFMGAAQNVLRHYSVETTQKTLDWIAFAGVGAGIYMPRLAAIGIERRNRASVNERPAPSSRPVPANGPETAPHIVVDNVSTFEDGHNG